MIGQVEEKQIETRLESLEGLERLENIIVLLDKSRAGIKYQID